MQKDVPHVGVIKTGCQGLCELGPLMRIEPYDYQYVHVQPEDCKEIVERTILEGKPVERLFYRDNNTVCPHPDDIPFLNQQTRIVLENCGKIDAESIEEYIAVAVQDSRQARNGLRLHARQRKPAMLYVMVMRVIPVHLWMVPSWKVIHIR